MSDLQCAATLVLAAHAALDDVAQDLAGRRVAVVYCSDVPPARPVAEAVAARWGLGLRPLASLRGAEDGGSLLEQELDDIADQHRGETVLVVVEETTIGLVVPRLSRHARSSAATDQPLDRTVPVELDRDADGWVLRRWGTGRPSSAG